MAETPEGPLSRLDALGIAHRTVSHPPVFTVEQSKSLRPDLPGGHAKNLFLRAQKGAASFLLAVLEEDRRVSVNALARMLGPDRLTFATAEELRARLGVDPGSVTPFGLVNAAPGSVRAVFDRRLMTHHAWVHVHPLTNTMTTAIRPADLLRFLNILGHAPELMDPPEASPA